MPGERLRRGKVALGLAGLTPRKGPCSVRVDGRFDEVLFLEVDPSIDALNDGVPDERLVLPFQPNDDPDVLLGSRLRRLLVLSGSRSRS